MNFLHSPSIEAEAPCTMNVTLQSSHVQQLSSYRKDLKDAKILGSTYFQQPSASSELCQRGRLRGGTRWHKTSSYQAAGDSDTAVTPTALQGRCRSVLGTALVKPQFRELLELLCPSAAASQTLLDLPLLSLRVLINQGHSTAASG